MAVKVIYFVHGTTTDDCMRRSNWKRLEQDRILSIWMGIYN